MKKSCLSVLLVACLFFACKKNHDDPPAPPPPPPPVPRTMTIRFEDTTTYVYKPELIFSEPAGKVLLDTVASINHFTATLTTDKTLLDVTYIGYDSLGGKFIITTYRGVNPSTWTASGNWGYAAPLPTPTGQRATVYFKNVPPADLNMLLINDYAWSYSGGWSSQGPGFLDMNYTQYSASNYVYFLMPVPGLYKTYIPKGLRDTVDLTKMDTVVKLNFNKPPQYALQNCMLYGFMDTTDYSKSIVLYPGNFGMAGLPDIEYPRKLVQKMQLMVTAEDKANHISAGYFSYGDSVASTLPLPDASLFTVTSSKPDNFSVQFASPRPSGYSTGWQSSNIIWTTFASPDSANFNPQAFLTSLNSKGLKGQSLSGLALRAVEIESLQGMDYQSYSTYSHSPDMVKKKRVNLAIRLTKNY